MDGHSVVELGQRGKPPLMAVNTATGELTVETPLGMFGTQLMTALVRAAAALQPIQADKKHAKQNWDYVSEHALFGALRPILHGNGLVLLPVAVDLTRGEYVTKGGGTTMRTAEGEVDYILAHTSGEYIRLSTWCEGQSNDDKAVAGALTSALKTILSQVFLISRSGGEPQADNKQRQKAQALAPGELHPSLFKTAPPPWKPKPVKIDHVERDKPGGGKMRVFRRAWHMQQETSPAGVAMLPYVPIERDDIGTHVCELSDTVLDADARKSRDVLRANGLSEDSKTKLQAYLAAVEFELERRHPEPRRTVLEPVDSDDLFPEVADER